MNNKGFAITGIIYTLFILFLMILLSTLSGLSTSKRMTSHATENLEANLEKNYVIQDSPDPNVITEIDDINTNGIAPYFGKYFFTIDSSNVDMECTAYLDSGTDFKLAFTNKTISLSPKDCNDYNTGLKLEKIYVFEGWN